MNFAQCTATLPRKPYVKVTLRGPGAEPEGSQAGASPRRGSLKPHGERAVLRKDQ